MSRAATTILGAAAVLLFAVGVALAIVQPGDLGAENGDDTALPPTSAPATTLSTLPPTTVDPAVPTSVPGAPTTAGPGSGGGPSTGGPDGAGGGAGGGQAGGGQAGGGSGLGSSGAGDAGTDQLVDTGAHLVAGPGLALAGLGVLAAGGARRHRSGAGAGRPSR